MIEITPYDPNIEDDILRIFNYLNGKVNTFNKAVLVIDWVALPSSTKVAYHIPPNIVYIYPLIVARYCPSVELYRFRVTEFLIHELTHLDQVIEFRRIPDEAYNTQMEASVEKQSFLWLLDHINDLTNDLNLYMNQSCMDYIIANLQNAEKYNPKYEKRTYADHIWMILDAVADDRWDANKSRQAIKQAIDNNIPFIIRYNGKNIWIQDYMFKMPIEDINLAFSNIYRGDMIKTCIYMDWRYANNEDGTLSKFLYVDLNMESSKIMCSIKSQ